MKEYRQKQLVQAQQLEYKADGRVKDWGSLQQLSPQNIQKRQERVSVVIQRGRITMKEGEWLVTYPQKPGDRAYSEVYDDRKFKALFEKP